MDEGSVSAGMSGFDYASQKTVDERYKRAAEGRVTFQKFIALQALLQILKIIWVCLGALRGHSLNYELVASCAFGGAAVILGTLGLKGNSRLLRAYILLTVITVGFSVLPFVPGQPVGKTRTFSMLGYGFIGSVTLLELSLLLISRFIFGTLYTSLINIAEAKYPAALRLAAKYALDAEEVFNARWSITSFLREITEENYPAALRLADKYALDADEVYKTRWVLSDFGREAIQENLVKLHDRKWVVSECRTRVCQTQEAMDALLLYGLMETEPYKDDKDGVNDVDSTWWFRYERLRLLQRKDRLETFLGMYNGRYFPKEYAYFCSESLKRLACEYAEGGKIGPLSVLLKRHVYSLAPSVLNILDALSETLPPHNYSSLLPEITPPRAFLVREDRDWVENMMTVARLKSVRDTLGQMVDGVNLLESTEHIVNLVLGLSWPTEVEITEWYKNRARTIDKMSGQLENSLSLLDWGQRKGVSGLDSLFEDVSDLVKVVLTSDKSEDSTLVLDLEMWESLDEYKKFQVMLEGAQTDTVVDRLREQAIPFLHRRHHQLSLPSLPSNEPSATVSSVLATWLREIAQQNRLEVCAAVFEESSSGPNGNGLFASESDMVGVALSCIYLCPAVDQWSLMKTILGKLGHSLDSPGKGGGGGGGHFQDSPRRVGLRKGLVSRFRSSVSSKPSPDMEAEGGSHKASLNVGDVRLRQAEALVDAGQLLFQYEVETTMKFLKNCEENVNGAKQILETLLRKFSSRNPPRSDSEWMVLWRDLCTLQDKAFPFLEKDYLLAELCKGSMQAGKFSLAKNYLTGTGNMSLHPDKAELVVLETARDFFYSTPSLDSPAIEMARNCLALLPRNQAVIMEENIIEAVTVKLPMLGVSLLPLEYQQVQDKMDVLRMALSARPDAYLNLPELMEVAMLLGLNSPRDIARVEAAIAREAAGEGDFALAQDLCLSLVKKDHGEIWDLCAALARGSQTESTDFKARAQLMGFALSHCDAESIGQLLAEWKDENMLQECHMLGLSPAAGMDSEGVASLETLSGVIVSDESNLDALRPQHRKNANILCTRFPGLLELSSDENLRGDDSNADICHELARECSKPSAIATGLLVHDIASHSLVWSDHLVVKLAQEAISSRTNYNDKVGCGYLMNVKDAHMGAEVLEQEVSKRQIYEETVQVMHFARLYAAVQDASLSSSLFSERKEILLSSLSSLTDSDKQGTESSRWTNRRVRTEEKLREMGQLRTLERMIPDADVTRFFKGDHEYITSKILELVGPNAKKINLTDVLALAEQYRVDRWQVLIHQLESLFWSELINEDEITLFWGQHRQQLLERPEAVLDALIPVYADLYGVNKKRLCQYFQVLADCASVLETESEYKRKCNYWGVAAKESLEASKVAEHLDFKHIVGLESVVHSHALSEVALHVDSSNVDHLASIISHLHEFSAGDQFPTSDAVYMAFVEKVLGSALIESEKEPASIKQVETFEIILERYNDCCVYFHQLSAQDLLKFVNIVLRKSISKWSDVYTEDGQQAAAIMLQLWTKVFGDAEQSLRSKLQSRDDVFVHQLNAAHNCCRTFKDTFDQKKISGRQIWEVANGILREAYVSDSVGEPLSLIFDSSAHFTGMKTLDACMKFLWQMVSAGSSLRAVLEVVKSLAASNHIGSIEDDDQTLGDPQDLQQFIFRIYSLIVDSSLETNESSLFEIDSSTNKESLLGALTSLSSYGDERDFEAEDTPSLNLLSETRQLVWQRLSVYAHDEQVPTNKRISILELQKAFRMRNLDGRDGLPLSWGDWDISSNDQVGGTRTADIFQSHNSLVALKSTEIVRCLWPERQITSEDLATVASAITSFTDLLAGASTREHLLSLSSLLKEWDSIFEAETSKEQSEVPEESGWGVDEGWEEFDDELKIHALHLCWTSLLLKMVAAGCLTNVLHILDGALVHSSIAILTEAEGDELVSSIKSHDKASALKVSLLLPYSSLRMSMLALVEDELSDNFQTDVLDSFESGLQGERAGHKTAQTSIVDEELIGLLLSADILPTVADNSSFPKLFAAVCWALGRVAGELQIRQIEELEGSSVPAKDDPLHLIAFPLFVAELTRAKFYSAAGALVLQFMRVPPSLAVWSAAYTALKRYLEAQCEFEMDAEWSMEGSGSSSNLPVTMHHLGNQIKDVPRAGLAVLTKDMKPLESTGY